MQFSTNTKFGPENALYILNYHSKVTHPSAVVSMLLTYDLFFNPTGFFIEIVMFSNPSSKRFFFSFFSIFFFFSHLSSICFILC